MDLRQAVAGFSTDTSRYLAWHEALPQGLSLRGERGSVSVWGTGSCLRARVDIQVKGGGGHRVFIGAALEGDVRIELRRRASLVYIGHRCQLPELEIVSWQDDDMIVVGNEVTTAGPNRWVSGGQTGGARPTLVIGDDCMFSRDIVLRNADGHPYYDLDCEVQHNAPRGGLLIEPHVWLGERAAVLKDVTVGACSVVAFGAVVTRDVPRFAVAQGVPARCSVRPDRIWARATGEPSRCTARQYAQRFGAALRA